MPKPGSLTYEELEKRIAAWEEAVTWIAKGWDEIDEYSNDVAARHALAEQLDREDPDSLPPGLKQRIDDADARFRAVTVEFPFCVTTVRADICRERHWYFFRVPLDSGMMEAYADDPDFRALLHLSVRKQTTGSADG